MRGTMVMDVKREPDVAAAVILPMYGIDVEGRRLRGLPEDFDEIVASNMQSDFFSEIRYNVKNGEFTLTGS